MKNKHVKLTPEAIEALNGQRELFIKKFGREPRSQESIFFDPNSDTPKPMSPDFLLNGFKQMLAQLKTAGASESAINLMEIMIEVTKRNGRMGKDIMYKGKSYFACEYFPDIKQFENALKISGKEFVKETKNDIWDDVETVVLL